MRLVLLAVLTALAPFTPRSASASASPAALEVVETSTPRCITLPILGTTCF